MDRRVWGTFWLVFQKLVRVFPTLIVVWASTRCKLSHEVLYLGFARENIIGSVDLPNLSSGSSGKVGESLCRFFENLKFDMDFILVNEASVSQ